MTIRIHFGAEDLARTQVAETPDPLWETLLSLHMLQSRDGEAVFGPWRRHTLARVPDRARRTLFPLAPPRGYSPDFLTPAESAHGLDHGIEALLSTPRGRLRTDLARLAAHRRLPIEAQETGARGMKRLAGAVRSYHAHALAPHRAAIRSHLEADRAVRARRVLGGGVEGLLDSLHAKLRWEAPVLELVGGRTDREVHLEGRGLRLIPSFFCWRAPIMLRDPSLPPVLVYPVERRPDWADAGCGHRRTVRNGAGQDACAALLGRTRAAALEAVATGCTTSELARRLNVSPATATHHTAVLREAGLIRSHRTGGTVHHTLGSLGSALLEGADRG